VLLLVDSSVLIDHLRGDRRAVDRLRAAVEAGDELWSVTVVRTEILGGARPSEVPAIADLFARLRWLDITVDLADAAGDLAATYLRSHPGVDTADYLIAAGALSIEAQLLTLNVRHFPMFEHLESAYA
jgi:predicted nucleic acid-binding protein